MKKSIIIIAIIAILGISSVSAYKYLKLDFNKWITGSFVDQLTEEEYNEYVENTELITKWEKDEKIEVEAHLMLDSLNDELDNLK